MFVRLLEEVADRLQLFELFGLFFDEAEFLERADELRLVLFDLHIELGVLFEVGNEALRLDLEDGRRNVEIVAHFVDVEVRKPPHIAEELFRDFGDKDILDLDLFLIDEEQKQIERAFKVAQNRRVIDVGFKIFAVYHGMSPQRAVMGQPRISVANCITQPRMLR